MSPFSQGSSSSVLQPALQKDPLGLLHGHKKAIILSGPTATGKTDLSLILAKALGGEVISADSMQVYNKMDIGTAKASLQQRQQVPHHLIDVCDLNHAFNVVEFYYEASAAMESIFARDKVPIIVGGTGFYIHTLLYGPPKGPPADENVRRALEDDLERFGPELMYEKIKEIDPVYAKTITPQDRHKVVRALEIMTISQKKVSDFLASTDQLAHPDVNFRCWFVHLAKQTLYQRIEMRCDQMIQNGLLDEIAALKELGLETNVSASQAIGYKQGLDYLASKKTPADYEEFVMQFKKASRKYAKRQFTWFRKEPLFRWLDLEVFSQSSAAELILHDFENSL